MKIDRALRLGADLITKPTEFYGGKLARFIDPQGNLLTPIIWIISGDWLLKSQSIYSMLRDLAMLNTGQDITYSKLK